METGDATMPKFCSIYTHGVDEKRRVQIPARWRPKNESIEFYLVLWPKYKEGPCIRGLLPSKFDELQNLLNAMSNADPTKPVLKRLVAGNSEPILLDKAGRLCIPERLAISARITNEVVLHGMGDRFEIWSPELHKLVWAADMDLAPTAMQMME
jgi:MraZ protein